MIGNLKFAVMALACIAATRNLHAQNAIIRTGVLPEHPIKVVTPFGETTAAVSRLEPSPDLLIVIAKDTLVDDDYPELRRLIASLYKSLHEETNIRIAVLKQSSGLDLTGPVRNTAELQTFLHKTAPDTDSPSSREPLAFITSLADGLDTGPPAWGRTLILGRIPDFQLSASGPISQYAAAWLARRAIAQKRILMFRELYGAAPPPWAVFAAQASGGIALGSESDPAVALAESRQLAAVTWNTARPSTGFELQMALIRGFDDIPNLALPSIAGGHFMKTASVPSITDYIELAGLVDRLKSAPSDAELAGLKSLIDRALAMNPSDRDAVKFGLALSRKRADVEGEIALLDTALDLNEGDVALWTRLGDLQYSRKNFAVSEPALLRARELGAKDARSAEELGRMRFDKHDFAHAAEFIDESLALNPAQQALWFLTADLAKELARAPRRTEALERGLVLGGSHVDRRIELIRIYLSAGDHVNAARHADLELPSLPADPDTQAMWAVFYEELARPDDALGCWRRVIAADPKREDANYAYSAILYDQHRYAEALDAAEHGLETNVASVRMELTKINSLEHLNRIYELRHSLAEFESADITILKLRAEIADAFGGDGPVAWRLYVEARLKEAPTDDAAKADLERTLARGWRVCIREGDLESAAWFEEKLKKPSRSDAPMAVAQLKKSAWIPGGFDALAFVAHGQSGAKAGAFLVEYCRTVVANLSVGSVKEREIYQKAISGYFEQLNRLLAMSTRSGDRAVLTLSLANKQGQSQTETVLSMFGWKLRRTKQQIAIESGVKTGQSEKQDLPSALGIDQGSMQTAFQAGKPFVVEILSQWAPVVLDDETWRITAQADRYTGGLAEALSQHPELARVYLGLSNVDQASASVLAYDIGMPALVSRYSELLARYSSALAIGDGRVMVPGGASAELIWSQLCGASPADPARFYRTLLEKDNGKLLAWFFALSQVDAPHQRFFTRSANRTAKFYEAFTQSADMRTGASRLTRNSTFTEFLREIPLVGESVAFPGSPEVWMVAQGRSQANRQTEKLLKRVRQVAAPELEDEILLRVARKRNTIDNEIFSELDNFLAVVHIDEHRQSGPGGEERALDDESALLLAQNYNQFSAFYPYFAAFRGLNAANLKTLFEFFARMRTAEATDAELILGQFYALTEATRLAMEFGGLPEVKGNQVFRDLCKRFLAAPDLAGAASAALDTVRDLITGTDAKAGADRTLRAALLGSRPQFDFQWHGAVVSLDASRDREKAFDRVLDLQKVPSVALLLRIDETLRRIAAGNAPALEAIVDLEKDIAELPTVEIPKTIRLDGHAKASLLRSLPARMPQITAELRQKASKKKINPDEVRKLCHELLTELSPQVRIALMGTIYAVYLSPDSILIADDPLLIRKHQAFELDASSGKKPRFVRSLLNAGGTGEGSFFEGGLAWFAAESARTAVPESGPSAALYSNQLASIITTPWLKYRDEDQRLLGLRIRMAREWCVYAADTASLLQDLSEDTLGVLSLTRRRALLNGIAARDWESVWASVTVSDLLYLADRYAARYPKRQWDSPVDAALRQVNSFSDGSSLRFLGGLPISLYGCNHPDRVPLAPYEEYERHFFPEDMAERAAEMKLYLAAALDRSALPSALMPLIAASVAKITFNAMRMSDSRDWSSAMKAFSAIDDKTIGQALEGRK